MIAVMGVSDEDSTMTTVLVPSPWLRDVNDCLTDTIHVNGYITHPGPVMDDYDYIIDPIRGERL